MKKIQLLGDRTPTQFLREFWHKKPLLIRQAIPGFQALFDRDSLFALAAQEAVESRLVTYFNQQWALQKGPFETLPLQEKSNWTVLLQGVNLHDDQADALMRQFNFIPCSRLDDLMISYATDQGGVGPHFDSYDVFLLQAQGQRRWRIGAQQNMELREGMPVKILKEFTYEEEFILEPGDMLYLPPHYAHDGVALGECMTYSIGFRAPDYQEIAEAFYTFMADTVELPGRVADPDLQYSAQAAEIGDNLMNQVEKALEQARFTADDVKIFLGEYLSEPKPTIYFDEPEPLLDTQAFFAQAAIDGVKLSRKTQMLYRGKYVFINGESFTVKLNDKLTLTQLANQRRLLPPELAAASNDVLEALYCWYQYGWLVLPSSR